MTVDPRKTVEFYLVVLGISGCRQKVLHICHCHCGSKELEKELTQNLKTKLI